MAHDTATIILVSDTANRAMTINTAVSMCVVIKNAPVAVVDALELMTGNKFGL